MLLCATMSMGQEMTQPPRPLVTKEALLDIDDIWLYIAQDNPDAADSVVMRIHEAIVKLAEQPGVGHKHEHILADELRVWNVYDYLIIYRPNTSPLEVVRVVHGGRDMHRLFR